MKNDLVTLELLDSNYHLLSSCQAYSPYIYHSYVFRRDLFPFSKLNFKDGVLRLCLKYIKGDSWLFVENIRKQPYTFLKKLIERTRVEYEEYKQPCDKRKKYLVLYKDNKGCCDFKFRLDEQEVRVYIVHLMKNFGIEPKNAYLLYKEGLKTKEFTLSDKFLFRGGEEVISALTSKENMNGMRELAFDGFLETIYKRKNKNAV